MRLKQRSSELKSPPAFGTPYGPLGRSVPAGVLSAGVLSAGVRPRRLGSRGRDRSCDRGLRKGGSAVSASAETCGCIWPRIIQTRRVLPQATTYRRMR